jgi:hypothetical protein
MGRTVSRAMAILGWLLAASWQAGAEIYIWTDERGIVHMTDQFSIVPESMRSRVSVRESAPASSSARSAPDPMATERTSTPPQRPTSPPLHMPSDLPESVPTPAPSMTTPYPSDTSALLPHYRPYVPRARKPSPPFPYNVRLDPHDPKFVWVGPNRVPKSTFTYPKVSLEKQAQFRDRLRTLEQRQTGPRKASPGRHVRPYKQ